MLRVALELPAPVLTHASPVSVEIPVNQAVRWMYRAAMLGDVDGAWHAHHEISLLTSSTL